MGKLGLNLVVIYQEANPQRGGVPEVAFEVLPASPTPRILQTIRKARSNSGLSDHPREGRR